MEAGRWLAALVFLGGAEPGVLHAQSCEKLASLSSPTVSITVAKAEETASFTAPGSWGAPLRVHPFCRVEATLKPTTDSDIHIEVWLPLSGWNGKFLAAGSGGWGGSISYSAMAEPLRRGYAVSATDDGHTGPSASFAMGHPEKLVDFAWRAEHAMTVEAKLLIRAFYGSMPRYSYWDGCSGGGREGLLQAARFPDEFDGIIAGDPANIRRNAWALWLAVDTFKDPEDYIPRAKYPMIHGAVLNACDAQDGVTDGLIENPEACHVDFKALQCKAGDGPDCLTSRQVHTAETIISPATTTRGEVLFPRLEPGTELRRGRLAGGPAPADLFLDEFRYIVYQDPAWDWKTFDLARDAAKAHAIDQRVDELDPDLSGFAKHGGKLLMYHGWADQQVAPMSSVDFYNAAVDLRGGTQPASDWIRLFMAPGMAHCSGAKGRTSSTSSAPSRIGWNTAMRRRGSWHRTAVQERLTGPDRSARTLRRPTTTGRATSTTPQTSPAGKRSRSRCSPEHAEAAARAPGRHRAHPMDMSSPAMPESPATSPVSFGFQNTYARLPERFHARVNPTPVRSAKLIKLNVELARALNLDPEALSSPEGVAILAGNAVAEGSEPLAEAYAGHQFGHFVPQLGDGRAILLGEVLARDGRRYDIQLKGPGPTPFSRRGDGRAALGPVLREYIVSEAMAALGVPTTRALAAVATGQPVVREVLLPGGVFTRVASSHLRVGTFQYFAARNDADALRTLADYAIQRHYPEVAGQAKPYRALFAAVVGRQARLVAQWMLLGFIHGVMNTDNTSISGETIDYGPCAFLEAYHPTTVFSSIDMQGRYSYSNQPHAAHWNLARLAEALLPLLEGEDGSAEAAIDSATDALGTFSVQFDAARLAGFRRKTGLLSNEALDDSLVDDLLTRMAANRADFTLTFRRLADAAEGTQEDAAVSTLFADPAAFDSWAVQWRQRLARQPGSPAERAAAMRAANPLFVPRNHLVEAALNAAMYQADTRPFEALLDATSRPYEDRPGLDRFAAPARPEELVSETFCGT